VFQGRLPSRVGGLHFLGLIFGLVGLAAIAAPNSAFATSNVGIGKMLCTSLPTDVTAMNNSCTVSASNVPALVSVYYAITLDNTGGANPDTVTLSEVYPTGFTPTGLTCQPIAGTSFGPSFYSQSAPLVTMGPIAIAAGQQVVCFITGYFSNPGSAGLQNVVTVTDSAGHNSANQTTNVSSASLVPTDLSILKTATPVPPESPSLPNTINISGGPGIVHYKIVVTSSTTGAPVYLGRILEVKDLLSVIPTSVPLQASLVAGSVHCTNSSYTSGSTPSTADCPTTASSSSLTLTPSSALFLTWLFPSGQPGFIAPGATITIEYDVAYSRMPNIFCTKGHDGARNQAFLDYNAPGATVGIHDSSTPNNTTPFVDTDVDTGMTNVDPYCALVVPPNPLVTVTKAQTSSPTTNVTWAGTGATVSYKITVQNVSGHGLTNVSVEDWVRNDAYTPPFTATAQTGGLCTPFCSVSLMPAQSVTGYGVTKKVATAVANPVATSGTVTWTISVKYVPSGCRNFATTAAQPIENRAIVFFTYNGTNYIYQAVPVVTTMAPLPLCHFIVTKGIPVFGPVNKIKFNTWFNYIVTYKNADAVARTVGTLFDDLTIAQPNYAVSLTTDYNYTCSGAGVSMTPLTGSGTVYVTNTQQPDQGVRIIQNTAPASFAAGAMLTCNIAIRVHGPPQSTQFCASNPQPTLVNLALMDQSSVYSPNLAFPPSPSYNPSATANGVNTNWASWQTPLPQCFNLLVNKSALPLVTWTTGGPNLTYSLTVQNLGDPIVPVSSSVSAPYLEDFFSPQFAGMVSTPPSQSCSPAAPPCSGTWVPPTALSYNPFRLRIDNLAHGQTMTLTYTVHGAFQTPSVDNNAGSFVTGPDQDYWYAANNISCANIPLPSIPTGAQMGTCSQVSVPVRNVAPLTINKLISAVAPATVPMGLLFQVHSNCAPFAGPWNANSALGNSTNLSVTFPNVPVGSQCSVSETLPRGSDQITMSTCPGGLAAWDPPSYPNPVGWDGTTQSATIGFNTNNFLNVQNTLRCKPLSTLTITKTISVLSPGAPPPAMSFPVNVSCSLGGQQNTNTTQTFSFPYTNGPETQTVQNIPVGSVCTIIETPWPPPPFILNNGYQCPAQARWGLAEYPNAMGPDGTAQSITIQAGTNNLEVHNTFACDGQTGSLIINKTFVITPVRLTDAPFSFHVVCVQPPNNNQVFNGMVYMPFVDPANNNPGPMQITVPNLPDLSVCTVTEVTPVPLLNPQPCGPGMSLDYVPAYPGGNTVTIHAWNVTSSVQVKNSQTCQPTPPQPPHLIALHNPTQTRLAHTPGPGRDNPLKPGVTTALGNGQYAVSVKKTSPGIWSAGSAGIFHIVVTNEGAALTPPVTVAVNDNLPAGMTFVAAAGNGWTCGSSTPVACTYSGAASTGQSLPPISVTAIAGKQGSGVNCATVSLSDSAGANNKDCVSFRIGKATPGKDTSVMPFGGSATGVEDVGISNAVTSGRVSAGGTGTFELTVTNNGAALGKGTSVEVRDMLSAGLTLVSASSASSKWTCLTSAESLTCKAQGAIPGGALPGIRVVVRATGTGTFTNCASVELMGANDAMPANNSSCATLRAGLDTEQPLTAPPNLIVPPHKPTSTPSKHGDGAGP
jgi:uncharacterized repeat protein (TIGR01451 family)